MRSRPNGARSRNDTHRERDLQLDSRRLRRNLQRTTQWTDWCMECDRATVMPCRSIRQRRSTEVIESSVQCSTCKPRRSVILSQPDFRSRRNDQHPGNNIDSWRHELFARLDHGHDDSVRRTSRNTRQPIVRYDAGSMGGDIQDRCIRPLGSVARYG